jgi:hypothetical protein
VFDAIRNHPNRTMKVNFFQITAHDTGKITLEYELDDFERSLKMRERYEPWVDIDRSLRLYLSGKIGYNDTLRA